MTAHADDRARRLSQPQHEFSQSVVFITGGAGGIGKAAAEHFLARGATVAVLDPDISDAASGCEPYQGSVTDQTSIDAAVSAVAARHGRIDILVNSAGVGHYGSVEAGSIEEWQRVIDINIMGIVRVSRACLPHLRKSTHGSIANIASALASIGMAKRALYSTTKGAVQSLTRAMAADYLAEDIRVNCVNPGATNTSFVTKLAAAVGNTTEFATRQATGHMVEADEVAEAILYLSRPSARSSTGSVLTVEAGFSTILK